MFVSDGVLSTELTVKMIRQLKDCKHLEDNEIELMNCLLSTYSRADIKSKKKLTKFEKRLLGQLAVVEFRDVPDGESVSLLNFPHAQKIGLVKLPQLKKLGQEEHNNKLYKRRIKTGKRWMNHLPGDFNSELIETLFLQLDPDAIKKTFKKVQNTQLRLNAEDSSSIKSWTGMTNASYVRFNWFLFYLTGLLLLAPIKHI